MDFLSLLTLLRVFFPPKTTNIRPNIKFNGPLGEDIRDVDDITELYVHDVSLQ